MPLSEYKSRLLILFGTICVIAVIYYYPSDEETILYKDNPFVTILPPEIHDRALEIYNHIPGTFIRYLGSTSTGKKLECSKHDFTIRIYRGSCNSLHSYLRESLRKKFRDDQVTELNPDKLAQQIVATCREKYENWGKTESSSAIFQFDTLDFVQHSQETMWIQVYVYADLSLECQKSFFSFDFFRRTCKAGYDLTIELKKILMSSSKILQLQQIISNNNVAESIKLLEKDTSLTWDDLDDSNSKHMNQPNSTSTWDDL